MSKDVKWPYVTVNYDRVGSDVLQTMVEAGGNRFIQPQTAKMIPGESKC